MASTIPDGSLAPSADGRKLPSGTQDHRQLTRRIFGGAIIVAATIVGLTAALLWHMRAQQLADGLTDLKALDLLVAVQTERTFESAGLVLDGISDDLQAAGVASPADLRRMAGDEASFRLLRAKLAGVPQLASLSVIDAAGNLVNHTRSFPPESPANDAGKDYFLRLRDHPELSHYVSAPSQSGAQSTPTIFIAKRLNAPNGAFVGIVLGALRLPYLETLYGTYLKSITGDGRSIALWRDDGTLLAQVPPQQLPADAAPLADTNRPTPASGLDAFWDETAQASVAIVRRQLESFPLIVELRQPAAAILDPWDDGSLATLAGAGALLALVGLAVSLLLRQLNAATLAGAERARADREARARADIERAMTKAEAAMRDAQHSEARFRDIVEVGSDWIWESDAQHRFTMITGARRPKVNLIGMTRWEQAGVDPETDEVWRAHKAQLDAHQPFRQFRFSITMPHGRFDVCVSGKPLFGDDGSFLGYRGTVTDETELVAAREQAARADALLRNAIDSIAEGFVIYDADDRFVLANEAYRKMYPENADNFVPGTPFADIMRQALATGRHPDAMGREEEWLAERVRKHRNAAEPEESRLADGRWVMRSERRMADGSIAGLRIDITALKQAQESLRAQQVMLDRAQRVAAIGCVLRRFKTGTVEWSDEMYRLFGLDRGDYDPGDTEAFLTRIHPEDRARVRQAIEDNRAGQKAAPMQFRILRKDGTVRWVYREVEVYRDSDGTPSEFLTTYKDVTDDIAGKERRRELEVLLHDAIDSISEGFVIYDADDRLVLCNDAYRRLYPEVADLIAPGVHFADILRAQLARGDWPAIKGHEEEWIAEWLRRRREMFEPLEIQMEDGRWIFVAERRMSNGALAGLRIDITAMKRVQQSLRESQQRLDRTQQIAHIGTVERDLRTNQVVWSDETYRIFGVDRKTYAPGIENFLALVHPDDRQIMMTALRRGNLEHANTSMKFRAIRPNGEIRIIFAQADVARDEAGSPICVSIAMMDVTDKELASHRQAELETQLRHSEKLTALGTLAGGIAHDLNNTLVPIQALSKLVMHDLAPDARGRSDLETIHQASLQARDLVRQILAFSRKQETLQEPTDVGAKVREALQMLRASVPSTIDLVEEIEPVPTMLADPGQIQQILVNLVTNAAYAIGDKVGRITISLDEIADAAVGGGLVIRLRVADNGCGMSPEVRHRIFEPFFTTKGVGEGTGLGLSVVHGIVIGQGGSIDVTSAPGQGSQFVILLPARAAPAEIAAVA